jgi:hypothetical protein
MESGGVLFIAGRNRLMATKCSPLADLLPVEIETSADLQQMKTNSRVRLQDRLPPSAGHRSARR